MDWLKKNYERALLGLAAVLLVACAGLVIRSVTGFPENFAQRNSPKPADNTIKPYPIEEIRSAASVLRTPGTWAVGEGTGSLFVSRPYILKDGALIDPLESPVALHPPITNEWLNRYDLPYWEGDVRDQDPDEDRFSNIEEFQAKTDPTDPKSIPPYWTKLRLTGFTSIPFRLKFTGTPDEGKTFTINTRDAGGRTIFVELGQMIGNTPYKVISYEPKTETVNEIERDVSELTVENTETKQKIILVARQEANDPTSIAEFTYLFDNSKFKVKKDDEFELAPETGRKYKLIDISEAQAVIRDLEKGENHTITRNP